LDISDKLDSESKERYSEVALVMAELNIRFLVIGASARDLFFEYAYGISAPRKTQDLDFAIQVSNWEAYEKARSALIERGFSETKIQHRLQKADIYPIDIIPFGFVADENRIVWPPDKSIEMNILGFDEAINNATSFVINHKPKIDILVAQPSGLILMKFIAWLERDQHLRTKDAQDIKYIMESYEHFPFIKEKLYQNDLLQKYDGDTNLIGAELLGREVLAISCDETKTVIIKVLQDEQKMERLSIEMGERSRNNPEYNISLLNAFNQGFQFRYFK